MATTRTDHRASGFLTQLIVGVDADLRKPLGRRDIAEQRELAYARALGNRPSQRTGEPRQVLAEA